MKAEVVAPNGAVNTADGSRDSGLLAIEIIARSYQVEVQAATLSHELGLAGRSATSRDLIKAAQSAGLRARLITRQPADRLITMPRPSVLRMKDGGFYILNYDSNGSTILRDPLDVRPRPSSYERIAAHWSGEAVLITYRVPDADNDEQFGFGWFISAAARCRKPLIHVLICSFFVQIFALVTPLFFQVIVDKVLVHKAIVTLDVIVIGLVIVGLFDVVLQYLRSYTLYHTASRIDIDLGSRIFAQLFRLPVSYFENRAAGQTIARIKEVETIRAFLTGQGVTSIIDGLFTIIFIAVLFAYSHALTLIVICSIPCYALVATIIRPRLRQKIKEKFNRNAISQQFAVESIVGALTLKAAAIEPILQQQWEEKLAAYVKSSFQSVMLGTTGQVVIQYISKLTTALTLYFGAQLVISGELTVGELVAFNMIANQTVAPVLRLSQLWQDLQQMQVSVDRLADIYNTPTEKHSGNATKAPFSQIRGAIRFENVSFRYRPDTPEALSDVSFDIPPGQVLGIVGPSGSGKSTLTKLVQRLYLPEKGRVLIDGVDLSQTHPVWFRRQIGVVLQENILFNRTIHENIALANPTMSRQEVVAVAKLSGADEFIRQLPQAYDTKVQERGANLSGGQRQRIAIARALARNPRILLLDEATSALDYDSERIVQENMQKIAKGRTVLIVAHRLAAVRDCNRIIALDGGRIVEDGSHSDLLERKNGLYRRLWSLQSGGSTETKGTQYA